MSSQGMYTLVSIIIENRSCCIELACLLVWYNRAIINLTNDFDHEVHGRLFLTCNCLFCYKWAIEWIASKVSIGSGDARCKCRSVGRIGQVNKSRTQWMM